MNQFQYHNQIFDYSIFNSPLYSTLFTHQFQPIQNFNQLYFNNYDNGYYPQTVNPQYVCQNYYSTELSSKQSSEKNIQQPREKLRIKPKKVIQKIDNQKNAPIRNIKKSKRKYLKKNTESNISNQVFSYLYSKVKSEEYLRKCLEQQGSYTKQKQNIFYYYMKIIKLSIKNYFNKRELQRLCFFDEENPAHREILKTPKKLEILSLKQFSKIIRILITKFLKDECISSILHSKKIHKKTQKEHFQRARQIKEYLRGILQNC